MLHLLSNFYLSLTTSLTCLLPPPECPTFSFFPLSPLICHLYPSVCFPLFLPQEFRQKVMLGTPFVVIWLVGFIADLDIDSWLIKGLMYAGMWVAVQFLSKYVSTQITCMYTYTYVQSSSLLFMHYFS